MITTPFSYVATTSSILWERCVPVFVDIEPQNFTIDPQKIEASITSRTKAIMPVHVFGYACNVEAIEEIAKKHNIKVIYDAAHAFGSIYKNRSLCAYGDISTLSFHATKLFHTIEGGACIIKDQKINDKLDLMKKFGHIGDIHYSLGINAKQDELNAAMGNVLYSHLESIIARRKSISELYSDLLEGKVGRPRKQNDLQYNFAYYPVLFKNEEELLKIFREMNRYDIFPRRYFYPSLNTLSYLNVRYECPISEDISSRIACLPLYPDLPLEMVKKIVDIICSLV